MRPTFIPPLLLLSMLLLLSCESRETKDAKALIAEARALQSRGEDEEAIRILDSLQRSCPQAVKQRREALALSRDLHLRISTADSAQSAMSMSELTAELERRQGEFVTITTPDMPDETLLRYRGYDPSRAVGEPFLDTYIQSDGQIEMVGGYTAAKARDIVSLRVEAEDGTYAVSDTIPYDGGRNYRFGDDGRTFHRLTLSLGAAERVARFVASSSSARSLRVSFDDGRGARVGSFTLSSDARRSISETYAFYATYVEIKNLEEKLSKHEARKMIYHRQKLGAK